MNKQNNKYYIKIKQTNKKRNNNQLKIKINKIPKIISIDIKNIYPTPKYLINKNIYYNSLIKADTIWGFIKIKKMLIPLVRLECLSSEVICETDNT